MKEKDIALAVTKLLAKELSYFANPMLTREVDEFRELWERSSLANTMQADLFISVHCNAAKSPEAHGTETLVYKFGGEAERLANKAHPQLIAALKTTNRGVKEQNVHVLRETKMPAILVETAFISNHDEEKKLANVAFQKAAARAIAQGIADYLGVNLRHSQTEEDEDVESVKVLFDGKELNGFLRDGTSYVEVRKLCEALGLKVVWDARKKLVEVRR